MNRNKINQRLSYNNLKIKKYIESHFQNLFLKVFLI